MDLHKRIGAWLTLQGCFFRVWARYAQTVSVLVQDGPYWEADDIMMERELARDGDYWSATVPGVRAWQLYRFKIELPGGGVIERLDPAARDVLSSELTRSDPSSRNGSIVPGTDPFLWAPFETPRFENFIIYECHIGSFAGRGDHFNKPGATFQDVESKFAYIRELGFNCIELLPVHEFAMDRSWGYNPASFFAPESSYGSPYNLMHFVDAAHRHGLAVIFDVVYNHAGPGDNVLWEFDGYTRLSASLWVI
jgi:1,4-alpha-glucan branching enzyme